MSLKWVKASSKDLGFIFSLALNGARKGHFEPQILLEKEAYRHYLICSIQKECDPRGFPTKAFVIYLNDLRVGAAVITTAIGTPDVGVEVAMIAIKHEFQGRGYGTQAVNEILEHYLPLGSVYARCLPASARLHQMLIKRNFFNVGQSGASSILRREPAALLSMLA
tara:strand:- start:770 stop:1267 length:498 start_codon:yes stop_codon:yes gene_type:complete